MPRAEEGHLHLPLQGRSTHLSLLLPFSLPPVSPVSHLQGAKVAQYSMAASSLGREE